MSELTLKAFPLGYNFALRGDRKNILKEVKESWEYFISQLPKETKSLLDWSMFQFINLKIINSSSHGEGLEIVFQTEKGNLKYEYYEQPLNPNILFFAPRKVSEITEYSMEELKFVHEITILEEKLVPIFKETVVEFCNQTLSLFLEKGYQLQ